MDELFSLLRIRVRMSKHKLNTRVIRNDVNPEWNKNFIISVVDPNIPVMMMVHDHDASIKDDIMGDAYFCIKPLLKALKIDVSNLPTGTIISRTKPCRANCLDEESCVVYLYSFSSNKQTALTSHLAVAK